MGNARQPVQDLHDYHEFHRSRRELFDALSADIAASQYRPRPGQTVRLEKRVGLTRRVLIPAPEDAVVLQAIAEFLEPHVLAAAPSKSSYYTRAHRNPFDIEQIVRDVEYGLGDPWPDFQERILRFTKQYSHLIVTDIANYYDTIPHAQIRNVISSIAAFPEAILDLTVHVLANISWRPDYLPSSGVGIPQLDFDAVSLLAHAYLFEVDAMLEADQSCEFARWADDIDIGVNGFDEARAILSDVDTALHTRSLHLNSGKTRILSAAEASAHFCLEENSHVTLLKNLIEARLARDSDLRRHRIVARRRFRRWLRSVRIGNWSKVVKRYIDLFSKLRDSYFQNFAADILQHYPELRQSVFRYFSVIGFLVGATSS